MTTYVPGYLGTITLSGTDFSAAGNVFALPLTKAQLNKSHFGSQFRRAASGQISGNIQFDGHVTVEDYPALWSAYLNDTPIPFIVQMGEAGGATDAGVFTGNAIFTDLETRGESEGEWEFSASMATDGAVTYTPPTP
jgi:hypothetical protein